MPLLKIVVPTRAKKFDSDLVESGPPAMLTDKGILLIYNGRNIPSIGDSSLPEGTYAGGQVLMDRNDPTKGDTPAGIILSARTNPTRSQGR
jgi:predicted GH43/DUF377 family glycosyl hydrolase